MPLPLPPSVLERVPQISEANQALAKALELHPIFKFQHAMRSGKVFFMWDFATRTDAMFQSVLQPATATTMTTKQKEELKQDAVGRCVLLHSLITDTTGKTERMMQETPGQGVDLGDEVKNASNHLDHVILRQV